MEVTKFQKIPGEAINSLFWTFGKYILGYPKFDIWKIFLVFSKVRKNMSYVYFSKKKAIHDAGVFHLKGKHLVANHKNFIN